MSRRNTRKDREDNKEENLMANSEEDSTIPSEVWSYLHQVACGNGGPTRQDPSREYAGHAATVCRRGRKKIGKRTA